MVKIDEEGSREAHGRNKVQVRDKQGERGEGERLSGGGERERKKERKKERERERERER